MRGAKALSTIALLAVAGCGAQRGELNIRSIPTALAQGKKPVSFRVAEARAQFALGNVALALEGFRKAMREEPDSIDAALGIAGCYVRMARFDLSQRYYETALAIDPRSPEALAQLAASLDVQGKVEDAARVRSELAMLSAIPLAGPPVPAPLPSTTAATGPSEFQVQVAGPMMPVKGTDALPAAKQTAAATVTVVLPQAKAPARSEAQLASLRAEPARARPHLERTSLGEIALITSGAPMWKAEAVNRTRVSTTVRFVPLRQQETRQAAVRLLNAARVNRLAARTRSLLARKGWEHVAIGDAPTVRSKSLIQYPARQRAAAERLAAEFGFALAPNPRQNMVTIYLGRDAVRRMSARSQG